MGAPRRRLAVAAIGIAVVVLGAELTARLLSPYLDEPLRYGDRATQTKASQLAHLRAAEGCVDVVFAGNSMSRDAIDPSVFTASDTHGRRAYNASLDAASPALLARWLLEEVEPRLHPRAIVVAVSSLDVNRNARAGPSAFERYETAVATRSDVLGRIQWAIMQRSALVDHRAQMRDPSEVWHAISRAVRGETQPRTTPAGLPGVIGMRGEGLSRRALRYQPDPVSARLMTEQFIDR